jgi:uncharacterized protein involved in response to NO
MNEITPRIELPRIPSGGIRAESKAASEKFSDLFSREPFRIFFPTATLAGIVGVSLWPLYFSGLTQFYPGLGHGRIMAYGLFGGYIFGFLGTAMPRMLTAKPLRLFEVIALLLGYSAMVSAFAFGKIQVGDTVFIGNLALFLSFMAVRARQAKDLPPPGFVLVALAFLCATTGGIMAIFEYREDPNPFWIGLQKLLSYQAFVLLPILGISPFILPRFFGMQSPHDFPESKTPSRAWLNKAALALVTGVSIIGTFVAEANGWFHTAYAFRFLIVCAYLAKEMPFKSGPGSNHAMGLAIRTAFVGILAGFAAIAFFPGYRVALLHLTLMGGFAIITFVVATRVVFGHSGNLALLQRRNRWFLISIALMLFAMATRVSGDFWPKIMASHYTYGALIWIAGVLLWAAYVLPKVFVVEAEG